ncbi:acid phosphatase type 7 [Marchantia polymorpha subsp. ruderalis]|uniref:Purple acid phosphatase n=2 Tax=Marchantia polymorpha TaxID=3197 RepID=A0A176WK56_MARPO|nr:hypothetical protein AXG93_107s1180 [Marchantia polymorpha subsp. ruderalis]PTQ27767.1 hypothetical protein MARPO_0184s0010 [Marchantia polymorpha]BBN15145.1 hypothetical protein Mp_6g17400 [Marchantia polymorpha subsp. ruderalis]|eukprot:PTQ27767.1 hypothetical protein MARPO_0184s0010 [Marchantia polymorpha]
MGLPGLDQSYDKKPVRGQWRWLVASSGIAGCSCRTATTALLIISVLVTMQTPVNAVDEVQVTSDFVRAPPRPNVGRQLIKAFRAEKSGNEPSQVHISMNGPNHMHITWITKESGNPSTVEYGTTSGAYGANASGTSSSYTYILYKSGEIHDVVIGPLKDDTVYYYRCGGSTTEYSFKTPPPAGPNVPITFVVTGDLGQTGWTTSTLEHIRSDDYDMCLYSGDLAYADYYQPLWDSFGELISPLARERPWMVTQGNHEIEVVPFFVESFRAYNARWSMPYKESGSTSNLYYSFEVAGCHILMLGSYCDFDAKSPQYKWLQNDLAKVDRKKTPWLITVLHAPWYNSNTAHRGDGDDMKAAMETLLFENKVDIIFAGHVHAYERSTRVYKGVPHPQGIIHINIGDGGNREGLASKYNKPQPMWSLFREASFGYGRLIIDSATTARWVWHRNDDDADVVADQVVINSLSDPNNPAYNKLVADKAATSTPKIVKTVGTK